MSKVLNYRLRAIWLVLSSFLDVVEHWNAGNRLLRSKKYYKAKQKFKEMIVSSPNDFSGYEGLALVYKAQGKMAEALFLMVETIRLAQDDLLNDFSDVL